LNILIVKLSSLGDVVHAMPAVQDIRAALPHARIDWVVEKSFAPLVARCQGVQRVIPCELRRWRKSPWSAATRAAWRAFRADLQAQAYDAVIDLQGLTKSALVAWLARLAPGGKRYALANQTDGSGYERPTRWVADVAVRIEPHVHAVQRSRVLCARALGYEVPTALRFGLVSHAGARAGGNSVAFVHGTSRDDKCWPESHWLALGRQLIAAGHTIGLPHGSDAEQARSDRMAAALGPQAQVWPRLDLGALTDRLAACAGVIGVDSGLSHIAVALDLPHVQIYNFDTAWRTGPEAPDRQCSVFAQPTPAVDAVWRAWQQVTAP
jgi:heptosyltransferase-1